METQSENMKMNRTKLKLSDLNPHLMCVLCGGYYIDATTIIECLHSFCRSCIVKHLESSKYCPICEVQVHKTKPLINIRADKTLQDIVYKLVPGLYASEMRNRRKFYKERPHYMKPNDSESVGEVSDETMFSINEYITLSLSYQDSPKQGNLEDGYQEISTPIKSEKRYLKCPTGVTIYHLQKLLKAKYELNDNNYKIELLFEDQPLHKDFTLLDIAYIYLSKNNGTLDLSFKIYESIIKRQKIDIKAEPEVRLEEDKHKSEVKDKHELEIKDKHKLETSDKHKSKENKQNSETKTSEAESQPTEISRIKEIQATETLEASHPMKIKAEDPKPDRTIPVAKPPAAESESVKENGVHNNESKEVMLQISESGVMSVSEVENSEILRTVEETAPKNLNKQCNTGITQPKENKIKSEVDNKEKLSRLLPEHSKSAPKPVKQYKTIRCSPKTWHPVITKEKLRPTLMKNSDEPKKPMKFFKARNVPRFLGNPSSGVKPMYADTPENQKTEIKKEEKKPTDHAKSVKKILKIDPKTLRPIEKDEMPIVQAPNAPNLLTNPFIPNNNHFLFSDPQLLPPNSGNYSNSSKSDVKSNEKSPGSSKSPLPNGSYPPLRFPNTDYSTNFYPYTTDFAKLPNLFPVSDKMDPFNRGAPRLSHFGSLTGFNMPGFHASLPPNISLLFNPHHHMKKLNPVNEKIVSSKEESTKETKRNCDDNSLKVNKNNENMNKNNFKKESKKVEVEKINKNVAGDSKVNKDGNNKNNNNNIEKSKKECKIEEKKIDKIEEKKEKIEEKKDKVEEKHKTIEGREKVDEKKEKIEEKSDKIDERVEKPEKIKEQSDPEKEKPTDNNEKIEVKNAKLVEIKEKIETKEEKSEEKNKVEERTENMEETVKNNDNTDIIEKKVENCNKLVDDCKSNSSACNDETKSETLNNDNKSVNDKER